MSKFTVITTIRHDKFNSVDIPTTFDASMWTHEQALDYCRGTIERCEAKDYAFEIVEGYEDGKNESHTWPDA